MQSSRYKFKFDRSGWPEPFYCQELSLKLCHKHTHRLFKTGSCPSFTLNISKKNPKKKGWFCVKPQGEGSVLQTGRTRVETSSAQTFNLQQLGLTDGPIWMKVEKQNEN